jgi:hypothetical protein
MYTNLMGNSPWKTTETMKATNDYKLGVQCKNEAVPF